MPHRKSVLVVDEVSDTEEVLRAVLEPRGLRVDRVRGRLPFPEHPGELPPAVVVIDAEAALLGDAPNDGWRSVPQVIIGTAYVSQSSPDSPEAERHYLRKPFHYAELIQTIERLIDQRSASKENV